jgi:PBP1b-binding outer membrane lipoprotein LpoB
MQTYPKGRQPWLVLGIFMLTLTACSTPGTRAPLEAPVASSGQWNDTDSRLTAEALIKDALDRPWAQRFTQVMGRPPVVVMGPVLNRTQEPLNTQTFVQDLERALKQSGQVQFAADAGQRQEVGQERLDQAQHTRTDTVKPTGQESSADFRLQGTINSLMDELDRTRVIFYQVDLELLDIASNVKVWQGQKKVKKLVERSKTTL